MHIFSSLESLDDAIDELQLQLLDSVVWLIGEVRGDLETVWKLESRIGVRKRRLQKAGRLSYLDRDVLNGAGLIATMVGFRSKLSDDVGPSSLRIVKLQDRVIDELVRRVMGAVDWLVDRVQADLEALSLVERRLANHRHCFAGSVNEDDLSMMTAACLLVTISSTTKSAAKGDASGPLLDESSPGSASPDESG